MLQMGKLHLSWSLLTCRKAHDWVYEAIDPRWNMEAALGLSPVVFLPPPYCPQVKGCHPFLPLLWLSMSAKAAYGLHFTGEGHVVVAGVHQPETKDESGSVQASPSHVHCLLDS